ncbi:PspC domain-containing protein [Marinirhabdus gelatinilytica]|uniref:Phage shock protein C (PspC) family protein n=1 Tax=Marinirhabdus gelatinilytica TaxID=1703343 RepID=A0A370QFJ8_9FLAO|nr:PspC domain-containing protein [Marinirhabdus gelatinilytica]RDK87069.1 phage shock protein C (PspC) family protein [Marinirhabdus gelatinilytica]
MKKTVNINLAGTFFHIDEDAFGKLSRYLEAIKNSLSDPQGKDEIIRDIEARISELFSEKIESSSQVISLKELDEVIAVMGQPEDYRVDEEMFDDTPPPHSSTRRDRSYGSHKQLFRDVDNKFISGVSSGLAHYLKIDAIWVRLLWILLTLLTSGTFIIVYILFWILVPPALTTSEKLKMSGEAVTISNIEKKFKEGYETVADRVKNADYDKFGQKVGNGAVTFVETLGNILLTILKIFVKLFGIFLILIGLTVLVSLIISLFTLGTIDLWGTGEVLDYINLVDTTNSPIWLVSLLAFFAVGIPFFVIFILGLKLLVSNLKSIGTKAKIILLVLWVASLIGLGIMGIRQATEKAYNGEVLTEETLPVRTGDTVYVAMKGNTQYDTHLSRGNGVEIKYDENDSQVIYSNDIRLIVKSTTDSVAKIVIDKNAEGNSFLNAKKRAEAIEYEYSFENGTLFLDGYFLTAIENKYRDQEIDITLFLPEGSILVAEENTYSFHRNDSRYGDILHNGTEGQHLLILKNKAECLDCPEDDSVEENIETLTSENENWRQEVSEDFGEETETNIFIKEEDTLQTKTTKVNDSI